MAKPLLIHADSVTDADMFAATGVPVPDPFTYIELDGRRIIVASVLEFDVFERDSFATEVWRDDQFGARELVKAGWDHYDAGRERVRRALAKAGVSSVVVPPSFPLALADYLRNKGIELTPGREVFELRRRRKDSRQLEGITAAQRATEAAMQAARELIGSASPGASALEVDGEVLTCERVREEIEKTLRVHGCEGEPPLVGAGPRGASVHDLGSGPIHPSESIIIDIFPQHMESRYHADMTRTFCWGEAPERLKVMYAAVLEALKRSTEAIAPGVHGRHPWDVACDAIEDAGFRTTRNLADGETLDEDFFHGLGHGVGVQVHEAPFMGLGGSEELLEGDVITVEPGVYRKDFGGVRLEDMVVVTGDGNQNLTRFDYELEINA
jgi:Xaa-Pro aminopeptidase